MAVIKRGSDVVVTKTYIDKEALYYSFVEKGTKGVVRKIEDGMVLLATTGTSEIRLVWVPLNYIKEEPE